MSGEVAALLLLGVVHVAGVGFLVWMMLDGDRPGWGSWWPRDERPDPPAPEPPHPAEGGLPLPGSTPARKRLRGPGRLADRPAPPRRPQHAPQPGRTRDPHR